MSDIDTAVVDSLKVLDPDRPIREADIAELHRTCPLLTQSGHRRIAFPGHRCDCVGAMPNRLSNVAPPKIAQARIMRPNAAHRNMKGFTTCLTIQSGMASIAAIS